MDAIECIKGRWSVRKFRPDPVPRATLEAIVEAALRSPSYKNTQPWEAIILSGAAKEALSARLVEALAAGFPPTPDIPAATSWPAVNQTRIDALFSRRGINASDPDLARKSKEANFRFYGAPHGIYLFQDSALGAWSLFDMGLFAQTLMLAAFAHGVGSVPQAFLTDYSAIVKEVLGIDASKRLCLGLSVGYADMGHPMNQFRTERAPLGEIMKWME